MTRLIREVTDRSELAAASDQDSLPKEPRNPRVGLRNWWLTSRARQAFAHLLRHTPGSRLALLPAYVGISSREGSGVLDPLRDCGWKQNFFRVDAELEMDVEHVESLLAARPYGLLLLIHFFGFPQRRLAEARALCDRYGVKLVEDCAHVLHGGDIGTVGDASFFSIHKTLPVRSGGILQINHGPDVGPVPADAAMQPDALSALARALVHSIGRKRIENYELLSAALSDMPSITLFRRERPRDAVPLNLPVLLQPGADRLGIYNRLNARGIGSTALYYQLVDGIEESIFPVSHDISRRILNLPIHQEIGAMQIDRMVAVLHELLS